jgi:phage-related protein
MQTPKELIMIRTAAEIRMVGIEKDISNINQTLIEIKGELKDFRSELKDFRSELKEMRKELTDKMDFQFKWLIKFIMTFGTIMVGIMAILGKGFHWFS